MSDEVPPVGLGQRLFTEDGREVGTVRGFDEHGVYVTTREGIVSLSVEHERAGHEFGEGELMWRCSDCGEMGDLGEGMPEACPNCEAPREHVYYWIED
ncbi:DUF7130 family rubredoxin-like protein [Halobaculum sp. EA56]|uniref:DUF7130 family rubredoxin-like protein n=1 Tax=Halobaculum sp. EA56 TaxID=3421648 RepID=UPI003EB9FA5E